MGYHRHSGVAVALLLASASGMPAVSQKIATTYHFDIPAQPLKYALRSATRTAGLDLSAASADLSDKTSRSLSGDMPIQQALDELLSDSGLSARIEGSSVFIQGRSEAAAGTLPAAQTQDIVVTGTRLKNVPVASPVITLAAQAIRDSGQASLAQALSTLPQNFGGGQNPGNGLAVPGGDNQSGASTINLRGVGSDATLTLLNGHRLSYDANGQGVDISSIPLLAVDRVEIVTDGASALYGSDAVAGVANILLRRDYEGVIVDSRVGSATDGGDFEQQYGILAGTRWQGGGIMAAYEFSRQTAVTSDQRTAYAGLAPGLTLLPALKHHDGAISLHQYLGANLTFGLDLIGTRRWNSYHYAVDDQGNYLLDGGRVHSTTDTFVASPSLTWTLGTGWSATAVGMIGQDQNHYKSASYYENVDVGDYDFCNCNSARSAEISATGPLFDLPGGQAKIAVGGGYRANHFSQTITNLSATQSAYYGFAEADLPIISDRNATWFAQRLLLTGAARYENYPAIDHVITPKLGLVYEPTKDVTVKGTWGRSFKAPTLYQQISTVREALEPAYLFGGTTTPGATAIEIGGGSRALKPERAVTWSSTIQWHPHGIPGLNAEVSYFSVRYRNRVVVPIQYDNLALTDPRYAKFVNLAPTPADIAAAISSGEFLNYSGAPFDPANVVAIIDDRNVNAGRQTIHGFDVSANYLLHTGAGSLSFTASATFLRSRQQLSADQPVQILAGTLYNPPHVRARGGMVWTNRAVTLAGYVTYAGGVRDDRSAPYVHVRSMTTIDLNGRYAPVKLFGSIRDMEISLSIQNLFNRMPGLIRGTDVYQQPYDSTNYSPLGRVISVGLRKSF